MEKIIVYGSHYDTAAQYAKELGRRTGYRVEPYEKINDLSPYDTVIHIGSLYAGGVVGLKKTCKLLSANGTQGVFIITVGLAEPADPINIQNIRTSIQRQIPGQIYERAAIFHLRGGIDYGKLSWKHRVMMKGLYEKTRHFPKEKQTEESRFLVETYGTKVDFMDFGSLEEIVANVQ